MYIFKCVTCGAVLSTRTALIGAIHSEVSMSACTGELKELPSGTFHEQAEHDRLRYSHVTPVAHENES